VSRVSRIFSCSRESAACIPHWRYYVDASGYRKDLAAVQNEVSSFRAHGFQSSTSDLAWFFCPPGPISSELLLAYCCLFSLSSSVILSSLPFARSRACGIVTPILGRRNCQYSKPNRARPVTEFIHRVCCPRQTRDLPALRFQSASKSPPEFAAAFHCRRISVLESADVILMRTTDAKKCDNPLKFPRRIFLVAMLVISSLCARPRSAAWVVTYIGTIWAAFLTIPAQRPSSSTRCSRLLRSRPPGLAAVSAECALGA